MFRFRDTCSGWERFRTDEALYPARVSHRRKPGTGCKGEALDGGHGGVPHNKVPPSPGEETPFSWRGEGGQGDQVARLVILTPIGLNLPLTAGWGPEWRFDLGNSRALRRKTHPILNSYQDS